MSVTLVMLLLATLLLGMFAPRLRVSRLVPLICVLLGFYLAALGFYPTIHEIAHRLSDFGSKIHLSY